MGKEYDKGCYERLKAAGLCVKCAKPRGVDGTQTRCAVCAERQSRRSRQHYHEHKEECRERSRRYARANPEKLRERGRRWRPANVEKLRELSRRHYDEHKEYYYEKARRWRRANPEKAREIDRHRYLRRRDIEGIFTKEQLQDRVDYYGGLCYICGGPYEHIDHVIPLSRGGTNWPANLRPMCAEHNLIKGAKSLVEFMAEMQ